MVANFSIYNDNHSSRERNQETLRKLAKDIFQNADKKERNIEHVITQREDYTTKTYIPAETYICNISSRAFINNDLEEKINFLKNKAAIRSFSKEYGSMTENISETADLFEFIPDESKNIFAA